MINALKMNQPALRAKIIKIFNKVHVLKKIRIFFCRTTKKGAFDCPLLTLTKNHFYLMTSLKLLILLSSEILTI